MKGFWHWGKLTRGLYYWGISNLNTTSKKSVLSKHQLLLAFAFFDCNFSSTPNMTALTHLKWQQTEEYREPSACQILSNQLKYQLSSLFLSHCPNLFNTVSHTLLLCDRFHRSWPRFHASASFCYSENNIWKSYVAQFDNINMLLE